MTSDSRSLVEAGAVLPFDRSGLRFDDGAEYRIEIATAEGAAVVHEIVAAAAEYGVPVRRVTQGSGGMLLMESELRELVATGRENDIEICVFVGPRGPWSGTASPHTPSGAVFGWRNFGFIELSHALRDVERMVDCGVRSVCVADEGLLRLIDEGRRNGDFPSDLRIKVSALLGIANPIQARILVENGADTLNVASDTSVQRLAEFRATVDVPLDLYIESPDNLGGFARYWEVADIVAAAAPVHLKFALMNAPNLYPSGVHLQGAAVLGARERVRRAKVALEILDRLHESSSPSL